MTSDALIQRCSTMCGAFRQETRERFGRIRAALADARTQKSARDAYDRLYQEFDSLSGSARAMNCTGLEKLYRAAAVHVCDLRVKVINDFDHEGHARLERYLGQCFERIGRVEGCGDMGGEEVDRLIGILATAWDAPSPPGNPMAP